MLKIAVCEDEQMQREMLESSIQAWAEKTKTGLTVRGYPTAEVFLFSHEVDGPFDCLFLDISMGEGATGLELAEKIRKVDSKVVIVFVTALLKYILKGYKVQAFDYLIKPLKEQDVARILEHLKQTRRDVQQDSLYISTQSSNKRISYDKIRYLEADLHRTKLHVVTGMEQVRQKISHFETVLPLEQFVKVHRSYIVNLSFVDQVENGAIILDDGQVIPVSRNSQRELDQRLMAYFGASIVTR